MKSLRLSIVQRVFAKYREEILSKLCEEFDVQLICGNSTGVNDVVDAEIPPNCEKSISISYLLFKKIWRHPDIYNKLDRFEPDVVIVQPTPRNISFTTIKRYCSNRKVILIGWGMGEMPGRTRLLSKIHAQLQKPVINRLDGIIAYSTTARDYYCNTLKFRGKIVVAHNSVDTSFFRCLGTRSYDFSAGVKLVFVGRITKIKQIDKLIPILGRHPNWELSLVGGVSDQYKKFLQDMASFYGAKIKFLGPMYGNELNDYLNTQQIFVLPGLGGLALNHAMASGLPVIASTADGTEEDLILHGETGFKFDYGNFKQLEALLCELVSQPWRLKKAAVAGRAHLEGNFSTDNTVDRIKNLIVQIND